MSACDASARNAALNLCIPNHSTDGSVNVMDKLMIHLRTPASHRYFWACVLACILGWKLWDGIVLLIKGILHG